MNPFHQAAKSNSSAEILKKRNWGAAQDGQDFEVDSEFKRRLVDDSAAAAAKKSAPAQTPDNIGAAPPAAPKPPQLGPDRLHKDSTSYVVVSKDHPAGEDPVLNPGYAVVARASTIADGMAQAEYHAGKVLDSGRVVLWIWSGTWNEPIVIKSERIDVLGADRPMIIGHSHVLPSTTETRVTGIKFFQGDPSFAMEVHEGVEHGITESSIEFFDCEFWGPTTPLHSRRRIHGSGCRVVQNGPQPDFDPSVRTTHVPAMLVWQSPQDMGFSIFRNSTIEAYRTVDGISHGFKYDGLAILATSRILNPTINGGYFKGARYAPGIGGGQWTNINSGLLLQNCEVYGSVLNEGWTFLQEHGAGHSGVPVPEGRGGSYVLNVGWTLFDGLGSAVGQIPAISQLDHVSVHSTLVARFLQDPNGTMGYMVGGTIWFRKSLHLCKYDIAPASPFRVDSTGIAHIVDSDTAAIDWPAAALVPCHVVNSPSYTSIHASTGYTAPEVNEIMLDMYML